MQSQKIIISAGLLALLLVGGAYYSLHSHFHSVASRNVDDDTDKDENVGDWKAYAAAVSLATGAPEVHYQVSSSTPQFVLLSFDGSKSVPMLNETLDFEQSMAQQGKPVRFTYFINASYFLTKDSGRIYQAPGQKPGVSNIGFSSTTEDIALRVAAFNRAQALGNEIGSHTVGHFDGSRWSQSDWQQEFSSFSSIMGHIQQNNPSKAIDAPAFLSGIRGFRAPLLGVNDNLYKVLSDFHFMYDTSGVSKMDTWPYKDAYGIWRIPLALVFVGSSRSSIVSMDYNFYQHQTNAQDRVAKGTPAWNQYFNEVLSAYTEYFMTDYQGNRAPVVIAGHFSKWNDGLYWEAMKSFAESVCGRPQVQCVTYGELVNYLNAHGTPPVLK